MYVKWGKEIFYILLSESNGVEQNPGTHKQKTYGSIKSVQKMNVPALFQSWLLPHHYLNLS